MFPTNLIGESLLIYDWIETHIIIKILFFITVLQKSGFTK